MQHPLGTISSEVGVQQGDPLSPLFFCLVLHILITAIVGEESCSSLLFQAWYQDDGVIAGPKHACSTCTVDTYNTVVGLVDVHVSKIATVVVHYIYCQTNIICSKSNSGY